MSVNGWAWDDAKNQANYAKHGIRFELAARVFNDPLHVTVPDPCDHEERWRTFGLIQGVLILVVHTDPIEVDGVVLKDGRIISSRRATSKERQLYENCLW